MGTEFRLYGRLNCNFFDLVSGEKEPQQTKGLGLLLSKSPKALELFLRLVCPGQHIKKLLELRCVVDCEAIQKEEDKTNSSKRADIVIRFYEDGLTPHCAIVVEAKGWDKTAREEQVTNQVINYCEKFEILQEFEDKITAVTLTANRILSHQEKYEKVKSIVNITWLQLLNAFTEANLPNNKFEKELIKNYCDYLLKIKGDMKFYETEVLSLTAKESIDRVKKHLIYECPNTYDNRYKKNALFFSFRDKNGESKYLYKVSEAMVMRFDNEGINALKSTNEDYAKRAEAYRDESHELDLTQEKWVLFLDKERSIQLPYPCKPEFVRGAQGPIKYNLCEYFASPNEDNLVILKSKKSR